MSTSGSVPDGASGESREQVHEFVCDLARRVGELQLSRYERPGEIHEKAPKDLVTEVDLLCEELLVSAIQERYPDDAILSEEQGGEVSGTGRSWLLDPVDGTANFSRANPLFCACVSVMEDGVLTHSAVPAPRLGDLYHAYLGGGAYRDSGGESKRMRVTEVEKVEDAFVGADLSIFNNSGKYGEAVQKVLFDSWQLRSLGSAGIRGAWVAAGYLDASIGTRNTAWDYAPIALLVSEAGGRATDLSGEPWDLESDGLLAANEVLHAQILSILND